jgi:hypothetical protein
MRLIFISVLYDIFFSSVVMFLPKLRAAVADARDRSVGKVVAGRHFCS